MTTRERRGAVIVIRAGDPEISQALASGIAAGMAGRRKAGQLSAVDAVTLHRGRGPDYWETMIAEARYLYQTPPRRNTRLGRLRDALLVAWAMIWLSIQRRHRP